MFTPTLPTFNIGFGYWAAPPFPGDPATFLTLGQLYVGSRDFLDIQPGAPNLWVPPIYIRTPKSFGQFVATPYVGGIFGFQDELARAWYYRIRWWDWCHAGFPNAYLQFLVEQCTVVGNRPDTGR